MGRVRSWLTRSALGLLGLSLGTQCALPHYRYAEDGELGGAGGGDSDGSGGFAGNGSGGNASGDGGSAPGNGGTPGTGGGGPDCEQGHTRCTSQGLEETCDADGDWTGARTCTFVCVEEACGGICVPERRECLADGTTPRICDETGQWDVLPECEGVCTGGECEEACEEDTRQCADGDVLRCENGEWASFDECGQFGCDDTVDPPICGSCTPEATECISSTEIRTCGANSQWGEATECVDSACQGEPAACSGDCLPGDEQCGSSNDVETCQDDGSYLSTTTCEDSTCQEEANSASCVGSCVEDTLTCTNGDAYDCSSDGEPFMTDDCMAPGEKCQDGACVPNPTYQLGHSVADGTFTVNPSASVGNVYAFPLPAITADTTVLALGIDGDSIQNSAQARVGIYSELSGGPGELLMSATMAVSSAVQTQEPTAEAGESVVLTAGESYWIAVMFSANPGIRVRANASAVGFRQFPAYWPFLPDPYEATAFQNGEDWPIFITVQDVVQ